MKKNAILFACMLLTVLSAHAQSSIGVLGGVNASTSSADDVNWRMGGFVGGFCEMPLSGTFYLQPHLLLTYQENQREILNSRTPQSAKIGDEYYSQWGITIPVLLSARVSLTEQAALRLNVGPYGQYAIGGKAKTVSSYYARPDEQAMPSDVSPSKAWSADFGDKITYGAQLGVQYEHRHLIITVDYKHSFHRNWLNMHGFENTIQLGVGYKF